MSRYELEKWKSTVEKILTGYCFRKKMMSQIIDLKAKDLYTPGLKQLNKLKKVVLDLEQNYPIAERYISRERVSMLSAINHIEEILFQAIHKKKASKPVWPKEYLILVVWIASNRKLIRNFDLNELRNFLKSGGDLEAKLKNELSDLPFSFPILREGREDEGETDWLARLRQDYIRQLFRKNSSKAKSLQSVEKVTLEQEYLVMAEELLSQ